MDCKCIRAPKRCACALQSINYPKAEIQIKPDAFYIDFGVIEVDTEVTKPYIIKNETSETVCYTVERKSYVHEIYQSFFFNKYAVVLEPKTKFTFKITYKPTIVNEINNDCFDITKKGFDVIDEIFVSGRCLGTKVSASTKRLYFYYTPETKRYVHKFELKNNSNYTAIFHFDLNEKEELYQISQLDGTILPDKSLFITLSFLPKQEGFHVKRLACLIFKHVPIIIELLALYTETKNLQFDVDALARYPIADISSYSTYINDYGFPESGPLPYDISGKYLDFGRGLAGQNNELDYNAALLTVLTNNMEDEIMVKWYRDPENICSIFPEELIINSKGSGYFKCSFAPDLRDRLYSKIIPGQIFWKQPRNPLVALSQERSMKTTLPFCTNITFIGHSFPPTESWISVIQMIPCRVVLPPCIPGTASYTTFMLKTDGHLPVLFKLVPPKETNFIVRPLAGMLRRYKIFVVKLLPCTTTQVFKEEWPLEINGQPQNNLVIPIRAQVEVPSILIGTSNRIDFHNIYPGCQEMIPVPVSNTSCFRLRVQFLNHDEFFCANPRDFVISSNEEVITIWTYTAQLHVPAISTVYISIRILSNQDEFIGLPIDVPVEITAACSYSQLAATPTHVDFKDIIWGTVNKVSFHLYNFGTSIVYYQIFAKQKYRSKIDKVFISNPKGKLVPNGKIQICMKIETHVIGEHRIRILYDVRKSEYSSKTIECDPIHIFDISYICVNPSIQIQEIMEHDFGPTFDKLALWHHLDIENINKIFRELTENESRTIKVYSPDMPECDKMYRISFMLKNNTNFNVEASLKRVRLCDCQAMVVSKSLTFRQKVFNCPHRQMLNMELSDNTIVAKSLQYLRVTMNFVLPNESELAYDLKLSKDRNIRFIFVLNTIPKDVAKISSYIRSFKMTLFNIFIGSPEPPIQTFWLYNNTSMATPYELIIFELHTINKNEGFLVLKCFNPSGVIEPHSCAPLLFRFQPVEAKEYAVTLPLILGDEKCQLTIEGSGIYTFELNKVQQLIGSMPLHGFGPGTVPAVLSDDHLVITPFPVWTTVEKMIFIRNISREKTVKYTWESCEIPGFVEVTVNNMEGTLLPTQCDTLMVRIASTSEPMVTTLILQCKIEDSTQKELHLKSLKAFEAEQEIVDQQFVIDERGTHPMVNKLKIIPPPEDMYIGLSISFHALGTLELQNYMDIDSQLSQSPFEELKINHTKLIDKLCKNRKGSSGISTSPRRSTSDFEIDPTFIQRIVECLIGYTLKNNKFRESLRCHQMSPYYIQFKLLEDSKQRTPQEEEKLRAEQITTHFSTPHVLDVSNILKNLLQNTVARTFQL